jgi:S-DNA-T family DNA segregation ATPase FtsK/SpoIIIE
MFDDRSLKVDIFALALLAGVVFLGVALGTYDPSDPPSQLVWPISEVTHNACGSSGAYVAHYGFETLGLGAYYVVGSLGVLALLMLGRREIDQPWLRLFGWVLSLVGLTTLAALAIPDWSPGPVAGSGGILGTMGRGLLEMHFARAGTYIFTIALLLAGLLLSTDYLLLKLAATTTSMSGRGLAQLGHAGLAVTRRRQTDLDSLDDEDDNWDEDELDEEDEDDEVRTIKIRTPADRLEDQAATTSEELVSNQSADASKGSGLKGALGLGKRKKSEREEIIDQLEAADQQQPEPIIDYELPPLDLLLEADNVSYEQHEQEVRRKAKILEKTFKDFGFNVRVVEVETGPVIAQFEVELEAGLRLSRIMGLADDLAIALRVPSVRIVAPIPGKNTVGIEIPNENQQIVRLREVIEEANGRAKRMKLPLYLGKDVSGKPLVVDLTTMPHLLIAGRTGTGKSVCLNSIIVSLLMNRGPDEVRMLMIDPKMVELSGYRKLPHLMHPVVTDMRKAEAILAWAVDKMEERYRLLARAGVRHVGVYNHLGDEELRDRIQPVDDAEWQQVPRQLPYIVIVADELADLMLTAGKDVEQHIIRLAQKSRAVGIHLILATQKPTVDVITGLIKSNLPARIAFQVASRVDSRVVLDEMGADKLLGSGDMLFLQPGTSSIIRGQGTYLSDDEITAVVDFVGTDDPQFAHELLQLKTKEEKEAGSGDNFNSRDELYEAAVDIVVRERRGSVSLLQRCLGIGYGRAARLIDYMAEDGVVGQYNGSQARDVLVSLEDWEALNAAREAGAPGGTAGLPSSTKAGSGDAPARSNSNGNRTALDAMGTKPRRATRFTPEQDESEGDADELDNSETEYDDESDELEDDAFQADNDPEYEDEEYEEENVPNSEEDELEDEDGWDEGEEEWEEKEIARPKK